MSGSVPAAEWPWLRDEVNRALDDYCRQLAGLTGNEPVPNLEWNVAELTAHLASLPGVYNSQNEIGQAFEQPADFAVFSLEQRSHIDTSDLAAVSGLLRSELTSFVDGIDDPANERWVYGCRTTDGNVAGAFLNELIMHGMDLAAVPGAGPKPTLSRRQANAAIPGLMAVSPAFIDSAKAAKTAGNYHVRFRGGGDWTQHIDDSGRLTVTPGRNGKPDATLSTDPATFIMVALGRQSQWLPALTGKMVIWGRKPWKMMATADITVGGI